MAKITDRREGVGSGLMNEPVLVFGGPQHGDLQVFNQDADWVGVARHGSGGRLSELHDADGVCLLGIEGSGYVLTFVLKGRDGNEVARIGAPTWKRSHTVRPISSSAGTLGCLKLPVLLSDRSTVEDATGNEVAQIHRLGSGHYTVQIAPSVAEPLRTTAVAASIVWDLTSKEGNGGGA